MDDLIELVMFINLIEGEGVIPFEPKEVEEIMFQKFLNIEKSKATIICIQDEFITRDEAERHLDNLSLYYTLYKALNSLSSRA